MKLNLIVFSSILFILILIWKPLIIFFIPGILLFYLRKNFIHLLGYCIAVSLSFWIITAWFIKFFNFSLTHFVYIISFIVLLYFIFNIKNNLKYRIKFDYKDLFILFVFFIILFLRFIPFFSMIVAPGPGDMSEHTYPTMLIIKNDGIPDSYEPIIPIKKFGAYAAGFHTISALISIFGDIPVYRATFFLSCLIYFLIHLALYIFINNFFNRKIALITSCIAIFLSTYPQLIFHWGGNPTSFSFFFILIGLNLLLKINKFSIVNILLISMVLVASGLTHSNPFLSFFYIYGFWLIYLIIKKIVIRQEIKNIIKNILLIVFISFLLLIPYLINLELDLGISEAEGLEMREKFYDHSVFISGFLQDLTVGPVQAIAYTNLFLCVIAFFGFFILFFKKKRIAVDYLVFLFLIFFLIIENKYWLLPLTKVLLTDRISLFFLISFSVFGGAFINKILKFKKTLLIIFFFYIIIVGIYFVSKDINFYSSPYNIDRTNINVRQGISLSLYQSLGGPFFLYMFGMENDSLITKADLDAFKWIEKNTNQDDIFINDLSGNWIPAIAFRPVLFPHIPHNFRTELFEAYALNEFIEKEDNFSTLRTLNFDQDRFLEDINNLKQRNIKYVYIGKKYLKKPKLDYRFFESRKEEYKKIYDRNGVRIYEII